MDHTTGAIVLAADGRFVARTQVVTSDHVVSRIDDAVAVEVAAGLLKTTLNGDYPAIGRLTSLIYVLGMVVLFFAPDNSPATLDD